MTHTGMRRTPKRLCLLTDFIRFNPVPEYKDPRFLHQKYAVEGLSIRQIAEQIFSSKEAVRKNLISFGIPLRKPHEPHGRAAQPKYGKKIRCGKIVTHLAEQRVIDGIRDMRQQGMSLRQIARFLKKIGVPTKCRGVSWHPEMVRRLLTGDSPLPEPRENSKAADRGVHRSE
jgi:hypothetical protein